MKKKFIIFKILIALVVISSCQKVLDVNTREDAIDQSLATDYALISNGIITTSITLGSYPNQYCNMWSQYWASGPGISVTPVDRYNMAASIVGRTWDQTYARSLYDLSQAIKRSTNLHHKGIAQIMMAYNYQMLVDLFGDVPYTEALKGAPEDGGILSPKFDTAKVIYGKLEALLDTAIANLNDLDAVIDVRADPVYFGDAEKWIKFANTLKLRILLRQTNVNAAKITEAQDLINSGAKFIDATSVPAVQFLSVGSTQNLSPLYATIESRTTVGQYFVASRTSINQLGSIDKRVGAFYKLPANGSSSHFGVVQGSGGSGNSKDQCSLPGLKVYGPSVPVLFMSAFESKFIQAEVEALSGGGNDQTLFEEGVQASFDYLGLSSDYATYIAAKPYNSTDLNAKIKSIAYEKWVAMNGIQSTEAWIETRRYDSPLQTIFRGTGGIFVPPTGSVYGSSFPVIFPYPNSEVSSNKNARPQRSTLINPADQVFWDN